MKGIQIDGKSEIVKLKILGQWAWMRNRLKVTVTPPAGHSIVRSGYTLTILRKNNEHGRWIIARDANLLVSQQGQEIVRGH
jgi:ketosteroid isomerase-like protein